MTTITNLREAFSHIRRGELRAAVDELGLVGGAPWRERARQAVRRTWMRYALRGVSGGDAHDRLDLAYRVADPWHMDSETERFRFAETNRVIESNLSRHVGSILEIGCGEGHQSEHLARLCDHLVGIDVSPTAIERARRRLSAVEFHSGDLYAQPWVGERGRFDLVAACEVIYYMSDIPRFLSTIDQLGGMCLVTYFAPAARRVGAHVMAMPNVKQTSFRHRETEWIAAWWMGASRR